MTCRSSLVAALIATSLAVAALALPSRAAAFCGFYVSGAEADLYNNATVVTLMREGNRTVMAMQNNYEGPPEDFALVVPVPEVLKEQRVKTLEDEIFGKLDTLTAPRLVEYWQKDPCRPPRALEKMRRMGAAPPTASAGAPAPEEEGGEVKVEAQFDVGEYNIVVLSATESNALQTWLKQNKYNVPDGAATYYRPYIEQGMYFFVAKVNIKKVRYEDGEAVLSPLRFHYDSDDFMLPVRLGLINAKDKQDVIAMILARKQRYEVANYPNATIPTNIPVVDGVRQEFGGFYESLFRETLAKNPKAVVTEYSWNASTCDPCPGPTLDAADYKTLGADVIDGSGGGDDGEEDSEGARPQPSAPPGRPGFRPPSRRDWVVTRLHARYGKDDLGEDLVFEKAPAIRGGRGMPRGKEGSFGEQQPEEASRNQFQARYIIRHPWEGAVDCENPSWRWGGPPGGERDGGKPEAAGNLAFSAKKDVQLASFLVEESVPGLGKIEGAPESDSEDGSKDGSKDGATAKSEEKGEQKKDEPRQSCSGGCSAGGNGENGENGGGNGNGVPLSLGLAGLGLIIAKRYRR